jgi:uncharacterized protein (DUF305 family)
MDVPRPSPASSNEPEVGQLATSIIESQRAEIET